MYSYRTQGTCSRQINFEVDDNNKLHSVQIIGGCPGNTKGICSLIEGMDINEVEARLKGIQCRNGTSCPDQLSKAIAEYKRSK